MRAAIHKPWLGPLRLLAPATLTTLLLAGCGLHNPNDASLSTPATTTRHQHVHRAATATATAPTQSTNTEAGTSSGPVPPTPKQAIEHYASLWCNWTSTDLLAHERQLEALAVGGARAQEQAALAAPAEAGTHITNTCTIESLAPGLGNAAGKWVLVTASHTSTLHLTSLPAQYHVTYVTVTAHNGRYAVNSWQPQS